MIHRMTLPKVTQLMPKIYITYRAGDTSHDEALKLSAQLRHSFGDENITLSQTKADANIFDLYKIVQSHDALLLLVGQRFSTIMDEQGRPLLHDVYDYLSTEIQAAIEKKEMWISVILTDDATMPTEPYLPKALRDLNKRDMVKLYKQHSMVQDIEQLRRRLGMIDAMITPDDDKDEEFVALHQPRQPQAVPSSSRISVSAGDNAEFSRGLNCIGIVLVIPIMIFGIIFILVDAYHTPIQFESSTTLRAEGQASYSTSTPRPTIPPSYLYTDTPVPCLMFLGQSDMPDYCTELIINRELSQIPENLSEASIVNGSQLVQGNELMSCVACHNISTNQDRESAPTLYTIGQNAGNRVDGMSAEEYLYFSLVDPDSYIVEDYQAGQHPNYIDTLSLEEISDIVAYLLTLGTDE